MAVLTPLITLSYRCGPDQNSRAMLHLVALPALVAGAWTIRELIMGSWPYGGFPWGRVAMSQSESPIAPVASWVGVSGLGFLMVAVCAAAIEAVRWIVRAQSARGNATEHPRTPLASWAASIPVLGLAAVM